VAEAAAGAEDAAEGAADAGVEIVNDRFGLGWRPELAAAIFDNLDRIEVVEVIADDFFDASEKRIRALKTLGAQIPLVLHGIQLGLASSAPVDIVRAEKMARLVDHLRPDFWSEHMAFVRGGGVEIGHLAAPPRNAATVDGAQMNVRAASRLAASKPLLENIATLIDPPGSDCDEVTWTCEVLRAAETDLLLDLHNLHANSRNFDYNPVDFIKRLPAERIAAVHLAGGRWIGSPAQPVLLDDHLHDVPDAVYDLLAEVGRRAVRPLTVILERDGRFPPIARLLEELDRARAALGEGRANHHEEAPHVALV
jgi:uncharacterized protein